MRGAAYLGWFGIVRLGLVQSALGAIIVLCTSTLNRVMVVEYLLPASLPAALVAWHYAVQLSRPRWGHGSDVGRARTPWIVIGMGVLALGALIATNAAVAMQDSPVIAGIASVIAYAMIGGGVAAAGTSLLALLASEVAPERRPAAASITWIMMIVGIVLTAGISGKLLDPFSPQRLVFVVSGVTAIAFVLTLLAVKGVERGARNVAEADTPPLDFRTALASVWREPVARQFTVFVFVSMLAYSAQDLILEPYAGLVFGYTLGQSTALAGVQHGGVLLGMVLVGVFGTWLRGDRALWMKRSTTFGCAASALALIALALAGQMGPAWPLQPTVFALGFANGVFAVSAIGMMMSLAGSGDAARPGLKMGVWGAAQAMAFGLGGFAGAAGLDAMRQMIASTPDAFAAVFVAEGALFIVAAALMMRLGRPASAMHENPPAFALGAGSGA
jgi:BCD family chlorophyll transporter-like MFS transporter